MNLKIKSMNMDSWHLFQTSISRKLYCHSDMWKFYNFVTFMNIWRKCCARIGTTFIATSSVVPCEPSSVSSATICTILNCANLLLVDSSWIWLLFHDMWTVFHGFLLHSLAYTPANQTQTKSNLTISELSISTLYLFLKVSFLWFFTKHIHITNCL